MQISNLKLGLMRQEEDGAWRVYRRGDAFPLVPNGPCVVEERERTCMWYGVEFDFTSTASATLLDCSATFSKPTDLGKSGKLEAEDASATKFQMLLKGRAGHDALSGNVYRQPDDSKEPWTTEIRCDYHGREAMRFRFTALNVD